jgi:hypothetical protein
MFQPRPRQDDVDPHVVLLSATSYLLIYLTYYGKRTCLGHHLLGSSGAGSLKD